MITPNKKRDNIQKSPDIQDFKNSPLGSGDKQISQISTEDTE